MFTSLVMVILAAKSTIVRAQSLVDLCSSLPCRNGGLCINIRSISDFTCICPSGFTGKLCSDFRQNSPGGLSGGGGILVEDDPCTPNPCRNGGECQLPLALIRNSNHRIRAALDDNEVFGDGSGGDQFSSIGTVRSGRDFRCACPVGFDGRTCETPICPADFCQNGGTCGLDLRNNSFFCNCFPDFSGGRCETRRTFESEATANSIGFHTTTLPPLFSDEDLFPVPNTDPNAAAGNFDSLPETLKNSGATNEDLTGFIRNPNEFGPPRDRRNNERRFGPKSPKITEFDPDFRRGPTDSNLIEQSGQLFPSTERAERPQNIAGRFGGPPSETESLQRPSHPPLRKQNFVSTINPPRDRQVIVPPTEPTNPTESTESDPVVENYRGSCADNPGICGPNALSCVNNEEGNYKCICQYGWMGHKCHRPCRDIYKSCSRWGRDQSCANVRNKTKFFDANCASTCRVCDVDDRLGFSPVPLPPILEPLGFLIGVWEHGFSDAPFWYPTDFDGPFSETLEIRPADVTMFGTPSINYTSKATSLDDPSDVRVLNGFLTLKPTRQRLVDAALLCTGNDGINTIEKGLLGHEVLYLNMAYMQIHPGSLLDQIPVGVGGSFSFEKKKLQKGKKASFVFQGTRLIRSLGPNHLEVKVKKLSRLNLLKEFTKVYYRVGEVPFL